MNHSAKLSLFPWLTLLLGAAGFGLRLWLLSKMDGSGLLPAAHPAGVLTIILLAVLLVLCFLTVRSLPPVTHYPELFPHSMAAVAGNGVAAAGFLYSAIVKIPGSGLLGILTGLLGLTAALCILYAGYCRLKGRRCHYLARVIVCSYLMLHLILSCRTWGSEPQLHLYLFQMLASIFLVLASYYRTVLDAQKSDRRPYIFFSQSALFCCMLCVAGANALYFLAMALWMATDCCSLHWKMPRYLKQ